MSKKRNLSGFKRTPSRTSIGRMIRRRRMAAGLTQTVVGQQVGLSQTQISLLEIGHQRFLRSHQITLLAAALGWPVAKLDPLRRPATPYEPVTEFGRLVRDRRLKLGLSYDELAKRMGVSPESARRLERRQNSMTTHQVVKVLAPALEVPLAVFTPYAFNHSKASTTALGRLLRTRRQELFLSLRDVAHRVGLKKQHLSMIELGRCHCHRNLELIPRLARVLNLAPAELRRLQPSFIVYKVAREPGSLGEWLTNRRLALGLTQRQVARRIKTDHVNISRIEKGLTTPSPLTLERLLASLNCELPPHFSTRRRFA